MFNFVFVVVASVVSPVVQWTQAIVQVIPPPQTPGVVDWLVMISNGAAVATFVSFLLEHVGPFQRLESQVKKWAVFGLYMGLPAAATLLLQFVPAEVWTQIDPMFKAIASGFALWVGSQVAHQYNKLVVRQKHPLRTERF